MEISDSWNYPVPFERTRLAKYTEWEVEPVLSEHVGTIDGVPGRRWWNWYGVTKD